MHELSGKSSQCAKNTAKQESRKTLATALALLLVCACISGCFGGCLSTLASGLQQAQTLAAAMHQKMTNGDLAGIYDGADQRYKDAVTRAKSDALFSAVANKLGSPQDCKQQGFNINATTSGTTLRLVCQTTFSKNATGTETFVWIKSGDQFRLLGYNIESEELIER
jgi:hypothetical protein